jgi:hypothetical protein
MDGSVDPGLFNTLNVLERRMLGYFDKMFEKMHITKQVRFHSHTLFAALIGIVATFRNHPDKSEVEVATHRKKIAENLATLFSNFASHQ